MVAATAPLTYNSGTQTVAATVGTTTGTVAAGDDSRFSNARTPTAHAASHASAGTDAVALAASQITSGVFAAGRVPDLSGTYVPLPTVARNPLTGMFHADGFGVAFDGATVATTQMQSLLDTVHAAGGGTAYVPALGSKAVLIDAPIVISSDTELRLDPDVTIKLKTGSNCNMITNAAAAAARTVMDGAISAASAVLTSATAAFSAGDAGKAIRIWGAGPQGTAYFDTTILTYTNSTQVTLAANATTAVTGAPFSVGPRDKNIRIVGGRWDRQSNDGTFYSRHSLKFRRVDGLHIEGGYFSSTSGKFQIHFADATNVVVDDHNMNNVSSDGVHGSGPLDAVRITNIRGATGDDFVALGCNDYTGYNDTYGPITDVDIEGLYPKNASGPGSALHLWAGPNMYMGDISASNIHGFVQARAVSLSEDTSQANTVGGTFGPLRFDNIDTKCPSSQVLFTNAGTFKSVEFTRQTHQPPSSLIAAIAVGSGASPPTIGRLKIADLTVLNGPSGSPIAVNFVAGTCDQLILDRLNVPDGPTGTTLVQITGGTIADLQMVEPHIIMGDTTSYLIAAFAASASTVARVTYRGGYIFRGRSLFDNASTSVGTTELVIDGTSIKGINRFSNITTPLVASLSNVTIDTPVNPLFITLVSGSTLRLRGGNGVRTVGTVNFLQVVAGTITVAGFGIPCDVALVTQQAGDHCYNTNAAQAGGVGPVVSDGTNWHNLKVPQTNISTTDIQVFTTTGTWTKPSGCAVTDVITIGAGGGGGSGRRGAAASVRCGGGGGASGSYSRALIQASLLGSTEVVTVGASGNGGTAVAADSTDGAAGTAGGQTVFGTGHCRAGGGGAGQGGTSATGTAGAAAFGMIQGVIGASASTTGTAGNSGQAGNIGASGGAGGGITSADAVSNGGAGGSPGTPGGTAGTAGASAGGNGGAGTSTTTNQAVGGPGGGGGGSSITGAGGTGGAGGLYGGGGGGGGASLNGNASGAGGTGAGGICLAISW